MPETSDDSEILWVEKYRPRTLDDVVAGKNVVQPIVEWAQEWQKGIRQKPLLLAGPPGTGKTSTALALGNTMGWEIMELNASDQRNMQIINRIVGEGAFSETLSGDFGFYSSIESKYKLIILDEVDNIHKREDYGGESSLTKIIKKVPAQPMILIANEPYKLSPALRTLCKMVSFRRLTARTVASALKRICKKEGIIADNDALLALAENAGGDLRAAVNDLQALAEGEGVIKVEDIVIGKRTQETDVFKVVQKIFKSLDASVHGDTMLLDETPDDLIAWIDENISLEYAGEELYKGYQLLSTADIFLGRVRRRQYYKLWKYASYLMTVGIQQVKEDEKGGFTRYKRPQIWQQLFKTKAKRMKKDKILAKIGIHSHLSKRKAATEMYYYISVFISRADDEKASKIIEMYKFTEDEVALLIGDEKRAKKIFARLNEKTPKIEKTIKRDVKENKGIITKTSKKKTVSENGKGDAGKVEGEKNSPGKTKGRDIDDGMDKEKGSKLKGKGKNATLDFFS